MAAKKSEPAFESVPPRENPAFEGHAAAEAELAENLHSARPAHAWLITGPKGIGKATLAFRAARSILAKGATTAQSPAHLLAQAPGLFGDALAETTRPFDMDLEETTFRLVATGAHGGLITLEREESDRGGLKRDISVGQVRRLIPFFGSTAAGGAWRVAIIDSADELNRNAANALLKSLEEPPTNALILLVSSAPGRLLPTIRSRCRILKLRPMEDDVLAPLLADRLPDWPSADRLALAQLAENSPGRALGLADEGGLNLYREMVGLLDQAALDVPGLHSLGDRLARRNNEGAYRVLTGLLLQWLERLIRSGASQIALVESVPGETALRTRFLAAQSLDDWVQVWEKSARLVADAESVNLDRKQVIINLFASIHRAAFV